MTKQNEKDAKRVPELRFKGFTDDWEQVELSEIADKSTLKNRKNENKIVLTNSAEFGIVKQQDYFDKNIANSKNLSNYYVVKNNYFVYNPRISNQAKYGPINYNSLGIVGIMSPLYFVFKVHNVNNIFLGVLFKTNVWHRFMYENGDTGARSDRFSIKDSVFMTMPLNIPSIAEQSKIAKLFQSLDKTITLHEEKQRQLEQLKKALLQKMFADETGYPMLRFKGFTEKWEQVRLSKTSRSYSGGTPKVGVHEYYDGQIPFIRSGEIASKSTELTISETGLNNSSAKLVSKGDILYALYGATSGEVSLSKINGAINQAILAIKPIDGYENYFLMTWLQKEKEQITRTYLQGGQGNLSAKIVMNLVVNIPSLSEQSQIAQIFSKLDKTITLHDQKIQYLKQLKRGLLQKVFI